jgi:hypothetical protein
MNKRKLRVATGPLNNIYAGHVLKTAHGGHQTWAADKQDVTIEALVAVAEHVVRFGKPVEISHADTGHIEYRISVEYYPKGKDE